MYHQRAQLNLGGGINLVENAACFFFFLLCMYVCMYVCTMLISYGEII